MPFQALLSADVRVERLEMRGIVSLGERQQQLDAAALDPGVPRLEVVEQVLT
jgi:hypothetical protein